jgi:hypothetical protein
MTMPSNMTRQTRYKSSQNNAVDGSRNCIRANTPAVQAVADSHVVGRRRAVLLRCKSGGMVVQATDGSELRGGWTDVERSCGPEVQTQETKQKCIRMKNETC